jgi:hypothetical protein
MKLGYALLLGRRCAIAAISAAGVSVMAAPASAAALPPGCSQSGQIVSCTQTFTSGSNPFTVPSGVSSLCVKVVSGQGGGGGGAFGAVVTGELPVTPGATIYAVVAGNGDGGGGNGGGPAGGGFLSSSFPPASSNGGGGGASDVRTSADELSSRVLVAADGGGGGGDASNTGLTPAPGSPGGGSGTSEDASATAGGPGGTNDTGPECNTPFGPIPCCEISVTCSGVTSGSPGVLGDGGAGGDGGIGVVPESIVFAGLGGGGGGGGLFGGGGGGGAIDGDGGGGGGGSNLVPTGGSTSVDTTGVPMVQISYRLVPTSKDQCKDGGWRNFPQFKNQGQCIKFVNHGK